jgi:hypothetical protein
MFAHTQGENSKKWPSLTSSALYIFEHGRSGYINSITFYFVCTKVLTEEAKRRGKKILNIGGIT